MQYRHLRIDYMEDCGPNEGGYYCQVFRASDDKQIDDFCIHSDEITAETDPEDMIRSYIDRMCHAYRRVKHRVFHSLPCKAMQKGEQPY